MTGSRIKAVIFDLDGTLLDTLQDLADCYNRVLAAHGFPTHPTDSYRQFVGDGGRKCLERALPHVRDDALINSCLADQQADYQQHWHDATRPYRGIPFMLDQLTRRGLALAVLSNKDHGFTRLCMAHFFAETPFSCIQGFAAGLHHKPDPEGAVRIAGNLGVEPYEIAFVGDTAVDIITAINAGMHPIGVLWGFRDKMELNQAGAECLIEHPLELPDCLDSLLPQD